MCLAASNDGSVICEILPIFILSRVLPSVLRFERPPFFKESPLAALYRTEYLSLGFLTALIAPFGHTREHIPHPLQCFSKSTTCLITKILSKEGFCKPLDGLLLFSVTGLMALKEQEAVHFPH